MNSLAIALFSKENRHSKLVDNATNVTVFGYISKCNRIWVKNTMMFLFFALVLGHFLCDYPLQGDFLARAKNRFEPIPHVPWYHAMTAHAFMHAAAVYMVLGVWWIAALEFISHFIIDDRKCTGELTYTGDQLLHLACKVLWVILALATVQL